MLAEKSIIDSIYKDGLCLGCGLCQSICGKDSVEMQLKPDGFFRPVVKNISSEGEEIIKRICPGTNVINDIPFTTAQSVWGKIDKLYSAYSTNSAVRTKGSSGGIVSAIAISLLSHKKVDAILQVGGDQSDFQRNALKISKTREDVLYCASSRYAPALIFDKIIEILEQNADVYCFIGKPCDISALKNFLSAYPKYNNRFKLTVSIMCAGMPSFRGTQKIVDSFNPALPVKNLVYRGNGWPGFFSFQDSNNNKFERTYNDSWGKTLNRHLNFRCKICPDGIGLQADIAVGDAWETNDGYPDFTEKEGVSLVITRTSKGTDTLLNMQQNGEIKMEILPEDKLALMQPYQFDRRRRVGMRLLAFTLVKARLINYKNMRIWYNLKLNKPVSLLREFYGTFKRLVVSKN